MTVMPINPKPSDRDLQWFADLLNFFFAGFTSRRLVNH
jgi:hypothetical protein